MARGRFNFRKANASRATLYPRWTPSKIKNLVYAWYDAGARSSISIGTGVSQWSDISGNGRHLVQANGAEQPAYESAGFNGLPTIAFDGSNDTLRCSPIAFPWAAPLVQPYTVVELYRPVPFAKAAASLNARLWSAWDSEFGGAGASAQFSYYQTYLGSVLLRTLQVPDFWALNDMWSDTGVSLLNQGVAMAIKVFNGASSYARLYGTQGSNVLITNRGLYGLTLGGTGFGSGGTSDWADVRWSEFMVLTGVPSTQTLELIEGYLAWKWNIVGGLAANHPYKAFPPR